MEMQKRTIKNLLCQELFLTLNTIKKKLHLCEKFIQRTLTSEPERKRKLLYLSDNNCFGFRIIITK